MSRNTKDRSFTKARLLKQSDFLIHAKIDDETIENELKLASVGLTPNDNHRIYPFMKHQFCNFTPKIDINLKNYLKINKPTPIQSLVIPYLLESNRSVHIFSKPGTGKTFAYLLPVLDAVCRMKKADNIQNRIVIRNASPYAIIVLPNSFLAEEVWSLATYLLDNTDIRLSIGIKSDNTTENEKMLREKGCDLYIGIIGKFTNAIKPKDERNPPILSSKYLKFLVLDDIPDKSFPEISEIIKSQVQPVSPKCRIINISSDVTKNLHCILPENSIYLTIDNMRSMPNITQEFYVNNDGSKEEHLFRLISQLIENGLNYKILIFVEDFQTGENLRNSLMNKFVDNAGIVGYLESETISYKEKLKIMSDFRKGIISVLIVSGDTKIIRSLNVPNVRTVINYDLPEDADDYIRKIGRCGRAYSSGNSITFFDSKKDKRSIINELEEVCENSGQSNAIAPLKPYI